MATETTSSNATNTLALPPDLWSTWEKGGKHKFLQLFSNGPHLKNQKKSPVYEKSGRPSTFTMALTELIQNGITGLVKKDSVVSMLQDVVKQHADVSSIILDILCVLDVSSVYDESSNDSKEKANYAYIVRECEKIFSDKLLKERLEIDSLQEVGILKNRTFYSKFIKIKTKLYYKQRKYNLFREECEGFAKLKTVLNQKFNGSMDHQNLLDVVHSLIGCFNLDPNRVLDVILESFENQPNAVKSFVPLVCTYMKDEKVVSEVLASKFMFLRNNDNSVASSLYLLTAQLLQHSLITLDSIYVWLMPDDKVMFEECEKSLKDAKEYIRKLQIVSTVTKDKEEPVEESSTPQEKYNSNQKLRLLEALLVIGDWRNAQQLISRMPDYYCQQFEPIALALCRLIHIIIEPLYREHWSVAVKQTVDDTIQKYMSPPEVALTFNALRINVIPMLLALGPALRFDPVLFYKILRLAKAALLVDTDGDDSNSLYYDILTVFDATILPSLCFLDCNCCLSEEIWGVLKLYPYEIRYCLYNRWKNETYSLYPDLMRKRADTEKQIKSIMKRVSKENVKPVGRLIGKLTHSAPGFLFDYILLQIQVYNNLINPVVDSFKYLTNLSYDVLGFCLVECLTNADKKRVKHDSTSISGWLQSLSSFCGAIYKKYMIDLTGLLQYVANQLKMQKSLDLLILKEIVQKMAGVEVADDLTMDQLNAMAGGELLKAEAGYFSQVRNTKKSSLRLKESMSEQNLAVALCLLMAQQKYCVVYRETQANHLKLVGKLADQCQDTLVQFGSFLGTCLTMEEYVTKLPSIHSMLQDYHIPNEVAFFLARPMFNHAINIKYDQLRKQEKNYKSLPSSVKLSRYFEAVEEVMQPVQTSIIPLHPSKTWEDISPRFLATFWSLTMYDLYVPDDIYQQVIDKTKLQALRLSDSTSGGGATSSTGGTTSTKSRKEQERFHTLIEKLQEEQRKQHEHVQKVLHRLTQEKEDWFLCKEMKSAKNETITRFLQLCLFPRCTFTSIDAVFCAKFVETIHSLKTPNFCTLLCYDRLFCDVTYSVTSCTENEAMRYGRFLYAMLETVMRWHRSAELFERECANYPGFVTKYRVNNQHADSLDRVNYENYRHVVHKWHYKLAKAMVICLESKDYVQIRNTLIILIRIVPFFPVLHKLAQFLEKRIEKVRDEEKNNRQDLYTLSMSYVGLLKQRIAGGHMIVESDFHMAQEKDIKPPQIMKPSTDTQKSKSETHNISTIPNNNSVIINEVKEECNQSNKEKVQEKVLRPKISLDEMKPTTTVKAHSKSQSPSEMVLSKDVHSRSTHKEESSNRDKYRGRDDLDEEKESRERRRESRNKEDNSSKSSKLQQQQQEDREYRNDRYSSQEYSTSEYADERNSSHYYSREDRDLTMASSNGSNSIANYNKSDAIEDDRDNSKRRKLDASQSVKNSKHDERKQLQDVTVSPSSQPQQNLTDFLMVDSSGGSAAVAATNISTSSSSNKSSTEKKERSSKLKEKREKLSDSEKELRKERKISRKRLDRLEDALQGSDLKRRRDDEKNLKMASHQNGDMNDTVHSREKHHRSREVSPHSRERLHEDRMELRDKQYPFTKHKKSSHSSRRD